MATIPLIQLEWMRTGPPCVRIGVGGVGLGLGVRVRARARVRVRNRVGAGPRAGGRSEARNLRLLLAGQRPAEVDVAVGEE